MLSARLTFKACCQQAVPLARRNDRMPGPIGERGRPVGYVEVDHNGFQTPGSEIERL